MKLVVLTLAASATTVAVVAATPQAQQILQSQRIQLVQQALPEMTQWVSPCGIELEVKPVSSDPFAARRVRILDLDPNLAKLRHPTTGASLVHDDRAPAAGVVIGNGQSFALTPATQPGVLETLVPASAVNWFSANDFRVRVHDASGAYLCSFALGIE